MDNMQRNEMPMQEANIRINNFDEVAIGYDFKMAISEANRCLNCKNPQCVTGCPVKVDIPSFISALKNENIDEAYKIISLSNLLPAVCGRVCPQERQCESKCIKGIKGEAVAIGRLERYVADNYKEIEIVKSNTNGKKIAVVGSGPSGLSCAFELITKGYEVTIFESLHEAGGVLTYGIPEFRLPKRIVKNEIDKLIKLGVNIVTNVVIGKTITVDELMNKYDAIYLATGAGLPRFMGIKGEMLNGVYSANEFLTRVNLMKANNANSHTPIYKGENVAVVGGGNVAMDAARTAKRLGYKNVYVVYRRSFEELPARKEELEHAKQEGIIFKLLNNPVEIIGYEDGDKKGFVKAIRCIQMELGEPDESGRRKPIEIKDSEFEIEVDTVIMAIGTSPNPLIKNSTNQLETDKKGCIVIDEKGNTSIEKIFAGGDATTGSATVISAMGAGKLAGKSIDEYLKTKS